MSELFAMMRSPTNTSNTRIKGSSQNLLFPAKNRQRFDDILILLK
jgi:hypothetical protein